LQLPTLLATHATVQLLSRSSVFCTVPPSLIPTLFPYTTLFRSMAIGAKLMAPHGGLFVLLIPGAITPVLGYLVAIIAGTLVAGLAYAFLKRPEVDAVAKAA